MLALLGASPGAERGNTMTTAARPTPVLCDTALYLGDNGACFCGAHAGCAARYSGRDISGQSVHLITEQDQEYSLTEFGFQLACETCTR